MIQCGSGFRWSLAEQDKNGIQLRRETQITRWSKDLDLVRFDNDLGICEHQIAVSSILNVSRHGFSGIAILTNANNILLNNVGGHESAGLLFDLFNYLTEMIRMNYKSEYSKTREVYAVEATENPVARLLESYLHKAS
jgi:hypothetical protein